MAGQVDLSGYWEHARIPTGIAAHAQELEKIIQGRAMKAVIHIGMPKSGTSTIQAFLGMNAAALSRQGVLYDRFDPRFGSQFELPIIGLSAVGHAIQPEFERNLLGLHTVQDLRDYAKRYATHLSQTLAARQGHEVFRGVQRTSFRMAGQCRSNSGT